VNTILFTITRRTREIAIHLAMGATYSRVFWIVISDVVKAGLVGLLLGALASWWAGKASAHFFYTGARYHGLLELMTAIVLMLLIIVIASLVPALRILRIEINRALAAE
jgi:ABC-type lipoprotein release transport system permease subunit